MKLTKLAALGAAAALALTACSNSDASPDTSPDNTAEVGGEVTVWLAGETDTPEDAVTWLKVEAKDQFDIDVTVERIGWGDLLSKVTTSSVTKPNPRHCRVGKHPGPSFHPRRWLR